MSASISVVINNFNYGRFLAQAIRSVLEQAMPAGQVELIVVDDGSTDDSRSVIGSFGSQVKAVFQPHAGQGAALNRGLSEASGEFICLLDSDDWWKTDKLRAVLVRFEKNHSLGMVQHWVQEVDEAGRPLPGQLPMAPQVYRVEDFLARPLLFAGTTGLSFRRSALEKLLPIPESLDFCADEYLYHGILLHAAVGNIPEALAFRRVHGANSYAGFYKSREGLERRVRVRAVLKEALERGLKERGLARSPEAERPERVADLQESLLLHRLRGERGAAFAAWKAVGRELSGGYRLFKLAALAVALVSPRLYLALFGLYGKVPSLSRARRSLLPD